MNQICGYGYANERGLEIGAVPENEGKGKPYDTLVSEL